jgi:hypothetical protein
VDLGEGKPILGGECAGGHRGEVGGESVRQGRELPAFTAVPVETGSHLCQSVSEPQLLDDLGPYPLLDLGVALSGGCLGPAQDRLRVEGLGVLGAYQLGDPVHGAAQANFACGGPGAGVGGLRGAIRLEGGRVQVGLVRAGQGHYWTPSGWIEATMGIGSMR